MGKRRSTADYEQKIEQGRCQGRGDDYVPYYTVQDIPSKGRVMRKNGIRANRLHTTLSDKESICSMIFELSDKVIGDPLEQFVLPLDETLVIAEELGIKHPIHPTTKKYEPLVPDFYFQIKGTDDLPIDVIREFKMKDDLVNKRVLEKFEIERVWCERNGYDWGIITEEELDPIVCKNIGIIYDYYFIERIGLPDWTEDQTKQLVAEFIKRIVDTSESMRNVCNGLDQDAGLEPYTCLNLFKYLIAHNIIKVDLRKTIDVSQVIQVTLNRDKYEKEYS